ncbi:hypothetical protein QN362_11925 [Actimicrobium sp. CCC2.4]|uniref:hypothetical protein n=1 Tax=Actimicrobium sp. CCC2.4 TaxID=3048606 RepID=UPI002AC99F55|nr:hypothetical protein [Actimicrobium sp. CCC2.4]MEB0136039.1 hypothetical protein [Actimicrobium sp. CCC2.4]WPX32702.1 hypothetical protein RHM62_02285 [Actimicrobium sp. CCC2.4]
MSTNFIKLQIMPIWNPSIEQVIFIEKHLSQVKVLFIGKPVLENSALMAASLKICKNSNDINYFKNFWITFQPEINEYMLTMLDEMILMDEEGAKIYYNSISDWVAEENFDAVLSFFEIMVVNLTNRKS